jgi:iduronate 2-sulfatase
MSHQLGSQIENRLTLSRAWLAVLAFAVAIPMVASAADSKPNVLMIIADDLNPSLGCYGNETVKTPNIDRLARRGVMMTRAYSSWASCLPSRVSLLSGLFPPSTGTYDFSPGPRDGRLKDVTYLPEHFQNQGYFTGRLDKVFHIGRDDPQSWTVSEEPYKDPKGNFKAIWTGIEVKTLGLEGRVLKEGRYDDVTGEKGSYGIMDVIEDDLFDGRTAWRAVELLEQQAKAGSPFFLAVGFRRPHLPWLAPKKYFDM